MRQRSTVFVLFLCMVLLVPVATVWSGHGLLKISEGVYAYANIKSLDYLSTLGAEKIIPGHGPLSGSKDVMEMKAYLTAFDRNAKNLCAAQTDIEQIVAEMIKRLPPRADGHFLVQANIQARYLAPPDKGK